jgi:hypothetical protein
MANSTASTRTQRGWRGRRNRRPLHRRSNCRCFADSAKDVELFLLNNGVDFDSRDPRRPDRNGPETTLLFDWDDLPVELAVFSRSDLSARADASGCVPNPCARCLTQRRPKDERLAATTRLIALIVVGAGAAGVWSALSRQPRLDADTPCCDRRTTERAQAGRCERRRNAVFGMAWQAAGGELLGDLVPSLPRRDARILPHCRTPARPWRAIRRHRHR